MGEIDILPAVDGRASINVLWLCLGDIQVQEIRYFLWMVPRFPANFDKLRWSPPEVFYDGLIVLLIILQVFISVSLWHRVAVNMLLESVQRTPTDSHIAEAAVPDLAAVELTGPSPTAGRFRHSSTRSAPS